MKAASRFKKQDNEFWANVRTISQGVGYTAKKTPEKDSNILVPSIDAIISCYTRLALNYSRLFDDNAKPTELGTLILDYFSYRARELNKVSSLLMNKDEAEVAFLNVRQRLHKKAPLPMNKQKGEKKKPAFLTGIVNIIIESEIGDVSCNYDPKSLTTITKNGFPLRTLSRRVDGAFPTVVNPIAIWEIKEYYYTTTFGSRVADGVYETLLDGMELDELEKVAQHKVQHLLVIDDYFTWWKCGRSYLCRIFDMLHMGYVDEVIFGKEVLTRLPVLVREWLIEYNRTI